MKKSLIKIFELVILGLIILFIVIYGLRKNENNNYYKRGALLIDKIETYRRIEKRLPNDLNELGIVEPMNDGPYYEKKDSLNYIVFFNIGFDNTMIYYSEKEEWKDEY